MHRLYSIATLSAILFFGIFPHCLARAEEPEPEFKDLPARYDLNKADAVVDALQIWRLGAVYFKGSRFEVEKHSDVTENPDGSFTIKISSSKTEEGKPFIGLDYRVTGFLGQPYLKHAVQFGCCRIPRPFEDQLEKALSAGKPELKLLALSLLLKVRAPASVRLQWTAWMSLSNSPPDDRWKPVLRELGFAFDPESVLAGFKDEIPDDRFKEPPYAFLWAIRAAGVTNAAKALPLLQEHSTGDNLAASLAAELSLEDFEGAEGDNALIQCMLGWKYNAYIRAGNALVKRNPALLRSILEKITAPEDALYQQGLMLAACNSPEAVPILCRTIGKRQIIDKKMFAEIERLAGPEHREIIEKLPSLVRPGQAGRAKQVVENYLARMKERDSR